MSDKTQVGFSVALGWLLGRLVIIDSESNGWVSQLPSAIVGAVVIVLFTYAVTWLVGATKVETKEKEKE